MKKYLRRAAVLLLLMAMLGPGDIGFAQEESIRAEIDELKARIVELEDRLVEREEGIFPLLEGISVGAGATFILQGTIDANATGSKGEDVTDGSYSVDIELEKSIGDFATAFLHLEGGWGDGVMGSDELGLFSGVNKDATDGDANMGVAELWYEHNFLDERLVITFGKLDATCYFDANEVANDECTQFLADMFKNSPVLEFPVDNAGGIRMGASPAEWIEFGAAILEADADWEDVADGVFVMGEVNLKPEFFIGRGGNYRFYGWFNDKDHAKLLDPTKTEEEGYGFGLSFDQELTDIISAFARFGWQDEEVYDCDMSWSAGLQVVGEPWNRSDDVLGIAVGQVMPGDDYKKAGNPSDEEGHFEAYYNIHLNDHLSISPDVQVIWNPKGDGVAGRDDTITVLGMRAQIDF